ncbi:MAG: helix-hairpin-helix domain-containing protein [Candidatus Paceibacteria bacterium]
MRTFAVVFLLFLAIGTPTYANHAVNINTADTETLITLTGIGNVKAQNIIDYRNANGPFALQEDIMNVSGIGPATYGNIKDHITITGGQIHTQSENGNEGGSEGEEETHPDKPPASGTPGTAIIPQPEEALSIGIGEDRTVFINADSVFKAQVVGRNGKPLPYARVIWSFGNGERISGYTAHYRFPFPGTYVVVASAAIGTHRATDRITVTAVPPAVAITDVSDEYIVLKNESKTEIDIGGWLLFGAGRQFVFPEHTIILPGSSVMVPHTHSGLSGADPETVALQYPNGFAVTNYAYPLSIASAPAAFSGNMPHATNTMPEGIASESLTAGPALAAGMNVGTSSTMPPIIGWLAALAAITGVAIVGVLFIRKEEYSEYRIAEIKEYDK